ncbi:hypothetical protein KCU94_g38, partial [Aureobasidium melanogenum]
MQSVHARDKRTQRAKVIQRQHVESEMKGINMSERRCEDSPPTPGIHTCWRDRSLLSGRSVEHVGDVGGVVACKGAARTNGRLARGSSFDVCVTLVVSASCTESQE